MRYVNILVLFAAISLHTYAQNITPNTKFGKPTDEELNMKSYDSQSDAPAVVLCRMTDVAYDMYNGSLRIITTEKVKVKILTDEGKEFADIKVAYRNGDIFSGLKGMTYNVEGGKLEKIKLPNDLIFKEKIDKDYNLTKFSLPQVKPGSVIEYQFRVESDNYTHIDNWYAQRSIPVLYAQYDITIPEWLKFKVEESGTHSFQRKVSPTALTYNIKGNTLNLSGTQYQFIGTNLPSLKDDDFVWDVRDYCNKVTCELGGIFIPGSVYKSYSQTWQNIDEALWNDEDFGGRLVQTNPFKKEMAEAGIANISNNKDKARAVLKLLSQKLKWNGKYGFWGKTANNVIKEGTGSNADLNFILISMLQDAGMKATPILLRTRESGRIPLTHPSMKYLNTFIVGVQDNDTAMLLLDASAKYGDVNILPTRLLVEKARVLRKGTGGTWTDVQAKAWGKSVTDIEAVLNPDGTLTGKAVTRYEGNSALSKRQAYKEAEDTASYVKKYAERCEVDINSYQLDGAEELSPNVTQTLTFTRHENASGDLIYLNPMLFPPFKKTPLTAEKRELPIEFPYKDTDKTNIRIQLPQGYEVETLPQGTRATTENGKIDFAVNISQEGNTLILTYHFDIHDSFFSPTAYTGIKKVFDTIAEKSQMMVVLKKK